MKLRLAIRDVCDAEQRLGRQLDALGERHKADHDVFHLTETLQRIARSNLERLAPHADRYAVEVEPGDSEIVDRTPEPGLLLVRDLRALHLLYAEASIDYVILRQGAQAARDRALLDTCAECHAQTLRGMKWTVTRIKTAAPQVLTS